MDNVRVKDSSAMGYYSHSLKFLPTLLLVLLLGACGQPAGPAAPDREAELEAQGTFLYLYALGRTLPVIRSTPDLDLFVPFTYTFLGRVRPANTRYLKTIYFCDISASPFLSADPGCEGQNRRGAYFSLYKGAGTGRAPLYRCRSNSLYFYSRSSDCSGAVNEGILGYVNTGG